VENLQLMRHAVVLVHENMEPMLEGVQILHAEAT